MDSTRSEDTMIFFGLDPQITDFGGVIRAVDLYITQKKENDPTDRFNFCAFEKNGPIYYEDFVYDKGLIIDALNNIKHDITGANLAGGIFLGVTQIIEVFKKVGSKCFRMVVLMDQGVIYSKAFKLVEIIVDQIRYFPFFIDFVMINPAGNSKSDVELVRFAARNQGDVYYVKSKEDLPQILEKLLEKKTIDQTDDKILITKSQVPFFENLGADLWVIDSEQEGEKDHQCAVCRGKEGDLVKCPSCGSINHAECLAQWAKMSNIGLPNVFRCMSCYVLLKLPKHFVIDVQDGTYKKKIAVQRKAQDELLREKESSNKPSLVQTANPFADDYGEDDGGWGSDEGWKKDDGCRQGDFAFKKDEELQVQFCDCGTLNLPEAKICSKCGNTLN